ncbi:polysaccharide biosynthesis tyrosine autokinase [Algoriphagus sp.]|uniref:GumC family protein n=1 Tax=Algoriphagus sp. TaxID=1872435 RepID=UPI00261EF5CB|nr:polysaccharide biosynthesis tyrosine autokinase [Algoriphagus sp.]
MEGEEFEFKESNFLDLKTIIPKILRIWPYILLSVFLFSVGGYFWTKYTTPIFKVSSLFFIKEKESGLSLFDSPNIINSGNVGLQNEVIIIKSKPITRTTLQKLDFDVEYYQEGTYIYNELYKNIPVLVEVDWKSPQLINSLIKLSWKDSENYTLSFEEDNYQKILPDGNVFPLSIIPEPESFKFGDWVETDNIKIKVEKTGIEESGEIFIKLRDLNSLVWEYSGKLQIQRLDRNASILNLSLETSNPAKGEIYLNNLMQNYLDIELREKNEISASTVDFIDSQVAGVADSLRLFESQLQSFRSDNKIYDLENEGTLVYEQLMEYETQLRQEEFKRSYYSKLRDYLVGENYRELVVPSGLGIEDPILNTLITNLIALQNRKSELLATNTSESPIVIEADRKIRELNESIREALTNVDTNSKFLIEDLKKRIEGIESSFRNLPETEQNLIRFRRQFDLTEGLYTFLMERRAEAAITKASNKADNKIIEPASTLQQIKPQFAKNMIISIFLGLMLPIGFVFLREFLRTKIEDVSYLENKLKVPVLSTILFNKRKSNLVVFEQGKSGIAEGFRSLRANIKFILPADKQLTMMVTSTISGEGKTFCSMNLASVYSLTGKKTVLIGCDMRKPKIFDDFKLKNDVGLSTYLSEQESDLSKIIKKTQYENLDVLVSGPTPPNPAELLFTERFSQLLDQLKSQYEVIILDTPPVGLVSETLDLLAHVDLTLFVFRQNFSQRSFVDALNGLKGKNGIKNIYGVFNGVDGKKVSYGYGYTYGYGYGYYDDDKV